MNLQRLINMIQGDSNSFEKNLDSSLRRDTGSYYTAMELCIAMTKDLIDNLPEQKRNSLFELKFLEPCVGTGNFVFSYILLASQLKFTAEQYIELMDNIYVADINENVLLNYQASLTRLAKELFGIDLSSDYFKKHVNKGLLFDVTSDKPQYISLQQAFGFEKEVRFDIVITNPPYKNLKAEISHFDSNDKKLACKSRYDKISKLAKKHLSYSNKGVLNLYKLFVEEIIEQYVSDDGFISLLIPNSFLTDKTCEELRTRYLEKNILHTIFTIPENNKFLNAHQALCVLLASKKASSKEVYITENYGCSSQNSFIASYNDVIAKNNGNAILIINESNLAKYNILDKFPKIKELDFIKNLRGELDLTSNVKEISKSSTKFNLLRGRNINYYCLNNGIDKEYVSESFVARCSKKDYILNDRIVCQQISNLAKDRRLIFSYVKKNNILGNSCNFLRVDVNKYGIDLYFLLGLLNSNIMNWYFKLQSSNNHINNYEINNFPIPVEYKKKEKLSSLVKCYLRDLDNKKILDEIELLVSEAFHLTSEEPLSTFDIDVQKYIQEKELMLLNNNIMNHSGFKLSDLDMEMIQNIPQGGNWKDIAPETVAKSQRLKRITQTGGRTTLYGRINYKKPSYTITTYFNRPGNGTYVHPIHNRVISAREAARFQGFPDSYYFYGNKTQLLDQIGNAVPPLFAYQIGKKIIEEANCSKSLDLFCGAGGLTYGFKMAGIQSVLSNDIDKASCMTLKINNPEIDVLCGDVTSDKIKQKLITKAKDGKVDIICGGPPCQGFSMAGFRLLEDPRNQLFKDFVDIVKGVNPKIVVFENVEGLLTFQNGETYKCIHEMFSDLGYKTKGLLLSTNLYGVPQKRKRVIIMCIRENLNILPESLYPSVITKEEGTQVTAYDTISDLEEIACEANAVYISCPNSIFTLWARGLISIEQYITCLINRTPIDLITNKIIVNQSTKPKRLTI